MRETRTFRVFVSSTFSDMAAERNALEREVFPRLRALCESHGGSFQAIDLRWGISEEAGRDQRAMRICLDEIARCQRLSPQPNFIALLGDRYGWRPLPDEIGAEEFDELVACAEDAPLLRDWYRLDQNAEPPVAVLLGRPADYSQWEPIEARLLATLQKAAERAGLAADRRGRYGASATEQEILQGALAPGDAAEHVFAFLRTIEGLPIDARGRILDPKAAPFVDERAGTRDGDSVKQLESLRGRLRVKLGAQVKDYRTPWTGDGPSGAHVGAFCEDVYRELSSVIGSQIAAIERIHPLERERLAHRRFGAARSRVFVGRTEALARISRHVRDRTPYPLVVIGDSGSGKSALMARAASGCTAIRTAVRFAGITPGSSRERPLLTGLLGDIAAASVEPPSTREGLLSAVHAAFQESGPLALFVDALDQIDEQDAPWVPASCPPSLRLIVSARAGTAAAQALSARIPEEQVVRLPAFPPSEASTLLEVWLRDYGRRLQPAQRAALLEAFARDGTPLFLKLAFEEARRIRSWDPPPVPGERIGGAVRALVARLSSPSEHGALLVDRALTLVVASKAGLAEDELADLLSADSELYAHFLTRSRHAPPMPKLPIVLWSRLRLDLEPYLDERSAGGKIVLTFHHRAIEEALRAEAPPDAVRARHAAIASYFESQPLRRQTGGSSSPNLRKLGEQVFQQAKAGLDEPLRRTLSDPAFLEARCMFPEGQGYGLHDLVDDCELAEECGSQETRDLARVLHETLVNNADVLRRAPELVLQQLHNGLAPHPIAIAAAASLGTSNRPWFEAIRRLAGPLRVLARPDGPVHLSSRAPAAVMGSLVALGAAAGIQLWDFNESRRLGTLEPVSPKPVVMLRFTSHGALVAAHEDGRFGVWGLKDLETRLPAATWNASTDWEGTPFVGKVLAADVSPDGELVAGIHAVVDQHEFPSVLTFWKHGSPYGGGPLHFMVRDLAFSSDGARLALAGAKVETHGKTYRIDAAQIGFFDLRTGSTSSASIASLAPLTCVAWFGSNRLAVGGECGSVAVCDGSGSVQAVFPGEALARSAARAAGGALIHVDESIRGLLRPIAPGNSHRARIRSLAFSPDGKWLASGASAFGHPGEVRVWDLEKGELAAHVALPTDIDSVKTLTPASLVVAGPGLLAEVHPFDAPKRAALQGHLEVIALAPDGERQAWTDGPDILLQGGRIIETAHLSEIRSLDWHPLNSILASGGDDAAANIWNADTGTKLCEIPWKGDSVRCVRFAPDGALAVAGDGGTLFIATVDGKRKEIRTDDGKPMEAVAISSGGLIAAGGASGIVHVFDRNSGARLATLAGHAGPVRALAFVTGTLVSAGEDGTVRVWDPKNGQALHTTAPGRALRRLFAHPAVPVVLSAGFEKHVVAFGIQGMRRATLPTDAYVTGGAIFPEADRIRLVDVLGNEYQLRLRSLMTKGTP